MTSPRKLLILLVAIGLILRLVWALTRPSELAADLPDQQEYLAIAKNMVEGEGMKFHDDRFDADVVAFRAPGYPILMALCGASVRTIRVVQALIDASVVLAVYLLARRFILSGERSERGEWISLVAAGLVALNPFLIYFSALILSETLFTALLAWGMVLIARARPLVPAPVVVEPPSAPEPPSAIPMSRRDVPEPPRSAAPAKPQAARQGMDLAPLFGAIVLVLAALVRPGAMILPAALLAAAAWVTGRRFIPQVILGAVVTAVVLFPWAYRNHRLLGTWVWTTTNAGHTAYDGFGPSATGASNLLDVRTMADLKQLDEVGRDRLLADAASAEMRNDLGRSARLAAVKIARTWSPMPLSEGYGTMRNVIVGLAYSVPLFVLTLAGLLLPTIPVRIKVLCLIPAIYFTAVVAISVGSLRYRIPAEPPMAVIAASTLSRLRLRKADNAS